MILLFLVILTCALACAAGATCRVIKLIEKQTNCQIHKVKLKTSLTHHVILLVMIAIFHYTPLKIRERLTEVSLFLVPSFQLNRHIMMGLKQIY